MTDRADFEIFYRNGSYLIVAPEFGVVARGADVNSSLQEAVEKVRAVEGLYREAGVQPLKERADAVAAQAGSRWRDAVPVAIVSGAIMSGLLLLGSVPLVSAATRVASSIEDLRNVGIGKSTDQIGRALDAVVKLGAAMDKVTPSRKEELRIAVQRIMNGLAPVLNEAIAACKADIQPDPNTPH